MTDHTDLHRRALALLATDDIVGALRKRAIRELAAPLTDPADRKRLAADLHALALILELGATNA